MSDETHHLEAQTGRDNVQDNSTGKTVDSGNTVASGNTVNSGNTSIGNRTNSHDFNFHYAPVKTADSGAEVMLGKTAVRGLILLALVLLTGGGFYFGKLPHGDPRPPEKLLDVRMEDAYRHGQRFIGSVTSRTEGWLYVVNLDFDGQPVVVFPNQKRQSAHVLPGQPLELSALEVTNPQTGEPVPLTVSFPPQSSAGNQDQVRERMLFFLLSQEEPTLRPGSVDSASQRGAILAARLLHPEDLARVDGGDEYSLMRKAERPDLIEQREFGYRIRPVRPPQ